MIKALEDSNYFVRNSGISDLPNELLFKTLINLDVKSILNFCSVNKAYSEICKNNWFWSLKANHDFNFPTDIFVEEESLTGYQKYHIIEKV